MEQLINQHGNAIVQILWFVGVLIFGGLLWFLKNDRKNFMEQLQKNADAIDNLEKKVFLRVNEVESEIDKVRLNYNTKFEKVFTKQDVMTDVINTNHLIILDAIHKIDIKVTQLKNK